jgi:hypothetical protein
MEDVLTMAQIREIFDELGLEVCDDAEAIKRRRLERSVTWKRQALSPNTKTQQKAQRRERLCRRLEEHLPEQMEVVRGEVSSYLSSSPDPKDDMSVAERRERAEELEDRFGLSLGLAESILSPPSSSRLCLARIGAWGQRLLRAVGRVVAPLVCLCPGISHLL